MSVPHLGSTHQGALAGAIAAAEPVSGFTTSMGGVGASVSDLGAATLNMAALHGRTPPERRFAWKPWIPEGEVTLLHGFGGVGKTLLAHQLATATAIGSPLFGGEIEGGVALMLAGEDSHDELWRRQEDIGKRLGCALPEIAGKLYLIAAPHLDITIAEGAESGAVEPAATFDAMRTIVGQVRPKLVVLDNSAKLFAVKEGDRIAVTRCVRLLHSLCHEFGTTVLLLAHNNKLGEFSGSTAWENACRSRLSLARDEGGETLTLRMPKANYSALGDIKLRWDRGALKCEDECGMTGEERLQAQMDRRQHAEVFLEALDKLKAQGRYLSHSNKAGNYAPKYIVEVKLNQGLSPKQLKAAMELLFTELRIEANAEVGKNANRTPKTGIARTGQ